MRRHAVVTLAPVAASPVHGPAVISLHLSLRAPAVPLDLTLINPNDVRGPDPDARGASAGHYDEAQLSAPTASTRVRQYTGRYPLVLPPGPCAAERARPRDLAVAADRDAQPRGATRTRARAAVVRLDYTGSGHPMSGPAPALALTWLMLDRVAIVTFAADGWGYWTTSGVGSGAVSSGVPGCRNAVDAGRGHELDHRDVGPAGHADAIARVQQPPSRTPSSAGWARGVLRAVPERRL